MFRLTRVRHAPFSCLVPCHALAALCLSLLLNITLGSSFVCLQDQAGRLRAEDVTARDGQPIVGVESILRAQAM